MKDSYIKTEQEQTKKDEAFLISLFKCVLFLILVYVIFRFDININNPNSIISGGIKFFSIGLVLIGVCLGCSLWYSEIIVPEWKEKNKEKEKTEKRNEITRLYNESFEEILKLRGYDYELGTKYWIATQKKYDDWCVNYTVVELGDLIEEHDGVSNIIHTVKSELKKVKEKAIIEKYRHLRKEIEAMPQYKIWRDEVLKKFGKRCAVCGSNEKIEVDHRYESFYSIVKKYNVSNTIQAYECSALWNIDNGAPLCKKHHNETLSSIYYHQKTVTRK